MHIRWHPEAQLEGLARRHRFYGERQPGLEQRFLDILEDALHRIRRRPQDVPPRLQARSTSASSLGFPYGIIYRIKPDVIEILAIMHLRRDRVLEVAIRIRPRLLVSVVRRRWYVLACVLRFCFSPYAIRYQPSALFPYKGWGAFSR